MEGCTLQGYKPKDTSLRRLVYSMGISAADRSSPNNEPKAQEPEQYGEDMQWCLAASLLHSGVSESTIVTGSSITLSYSSLASHDMFQNPAAYHQTRSVVHSSCLSPTSGLLCHDLAHCQSQVYKENHQSGNANPPHHGDDGTTVVKHLGPVLEHLKPLWKIKRWLAGLWLGIIMLGLLSGCAMVHATSTLPGLVILASIAAVKVFTDVQSILLPGPATQGNAPDGNALHVAPAEQVAATAVPGHQACASMQSGLVCSMQKPATSSKQALLDGPGCQQSAAHSKERLLQELWDLQAILSSNGLSDVNTIQECDPELQVNLDFLAGHDEQYAGLTDEDTAKISKPSYNRRSSLSVNWNMGSVAQANMMAPAKLGLLHTAQATSTLLGEALPAPTSAPAITFSRSHRRRIMETTRQMRLYSPPLLHMQATMKIGHVEPTHLQPTSLCNLRQEMESRCPEVTVLGAGARSGCIQLQLDLLFAGGQGQGNQPEQHAGVEGAAIGGHHVVELTAPCWLTWLQMPMASMDVAEMLLKVDGETQVALWQKSSRHWRMLGPLAQNAVDAMPVIVAVDMPFVVSTTTGQGSIQPDVDESATTSAMQGLTSPSQHLNRSQSRRREKPALDMCVVISMDAELHRHPFVMSRAQALGEGTGGALNVLLRCGEGYHDTAVGRCGFLSSSNSSSTESALDKSAVLPDAEQLLQQRSENSVLSEAELQQQLQLQAQHGKRLLLVQLLGDMPDMKQEQQAVVEVWQGSRLAHTWSLPVVPNSWDLEAAVTELGSLTRFRKQQSVAAPHHSSNVPSPLSSSEGVPAVTSSDTLLRSAGSSEVSEGDASGPQAAAREAAQGMSEAADPALAALLPHLEPGKTLDGFTTVQSQPLLDDLAAWLQYVALADQQARTNQAEGIASTSTSTTFSSNTSAPRASYPVNSPQLLASARALPGFKQHMESMGLALLEHFVAHGCPYLSQHVLEGVLGPGVGLTFSKVVSKHCNPSKQSLLHLAVQSGRPSMVRTVVRWGKEHDYQWSWKILDANGHTPLHLAVILPDGGRLARTLLKYSVAAQGLWPTFVGGCGLSPAQLARQQGIVIAVPEAHPAVQAQPQQLEGVQPAGAVVVAGDLVPAAVALAELQQRGYLLVRVSERGVQEGDAPVRPGASSAGDGRALRDDGASAVAGAQDQGGPDAVVPEVRSGPSTVSQARKRSSVWQQPVPDVSEPASGQDACVDSQELSSKAGSALDPHQPIRPHPSSVWRACIQGFQPPEAERQLQLKIAKQVAPVAMCWSAYQICVQLVMLVIHAHKHKQVLLAVASAVPTVAVNGLIMFMVAKGWLQYLEVMFTMCGLQRAIVFVLHTYGYVQLPCSIESMSRGQWSDFIIEVMLIGFIEQVRVPKVLLWRLPHTAGSALLYTSWQAPHPALRAVVIHSIGAAVSIMLDLYHRFMYIKQLAALAVDRAPPEHLAASSRLPSQSHPALAMPAAVKVKDKTV